MDPLSITASVVGLTATCVQTAKALGDLKDKFQNAHLTIAAICTETTIISASLSRIQSSMLGSPDGLKHKLTQRPDLESTLDQALTGCYVVFDVLQAEIDKLSESSEPDSSGLGFRARLRYVWNEGTMQEILTQIRGLQTALTLLLQLLGTDTMAELKQMMDNNTTVLTQVVQRTAHFRSTRPSRAPLSIFDMSFATRSIRSVDSGSLISSTRFAFDDQIVNSEAYRRALAKAYAHVKGEDQAQIVGGGAEADAAEQGVLGDEKLALDTGIIETRSGPDESTAESKSGTTRLEEQTHSLAIADTLILGSSSRDPFMEFMSEEQTIEKDWNSLWLLQEADVANVSRKELQRQQVIHELITTEKAYLDQLQAVRYLYKYRLILDMSLTTNLILPNESRLSVCDFPGCEDLYHANKTLLYDPLKSQQASEGPWISAFWDIFQNWLKQSSRLYIDYVSFYPQVKHAVTEEAKRNARFSRFLDQGREHQSSKRLEWITLLSSPITRVQRYTLLLATILRVSDRSDPRQECGKLDKLLKDLLDLRARCDVMLSRSSQSVEVAELRSRLGDGAERLLPSSAEIELIQPMLYKESRFKDASEVTVLVIRKPDMVILVLRDAALIRGVGESEVLAELRGSIHVQIATLVKDGRYSVKLLSSLNPNHSTVDGAATSISLITWSQQEAFRLHHAVLAIGGKYLDVLPDGWDVMN